MSSGLPGWPSVTPEGPICASDLAYMTGAIMVLLAGVILARLLSKWPDLALTSNTRIKPRAAKFLSNIIRYALWAVVGFVGTVAYNRFLLRQGIID